MNQSYFDFVNQLSSIILKASRIKLRQITKGKIKNISRSILVKDLINSINLPEEKNTIRTIHKAKGTQFETVLLYLNDSKDLKYIINPDIEHEEDEHRIRYVALSRAENILFISVPSIEEEEIQQLKALGIDIQFLDN